MTDPGSATIHDFENKLKECTLEACCGREYILVEKLTRWLKGDGQGSNKAPLRRLLREVYPDAVYPPRDADRIWAVNDGCLLVFCILLHIGSAKLIDGFQRHRIIDSQLPIDSITLRKRVGRVQISQESEVVEKFYQTQWRFCPASFSPSMSVSFHRRCIVPIHRSDVINTKGGTATLWQIAVYEEFVSDDLREVVSKSRSEEDEDGSGHFYQFALKTFPGNSNGYQMFKSEKNAFNSLRSHDGMVRYLGDYDHEDYKDSIDLSVSDGSLDDPERKTYNILLEYGDYDLDEYFETFDPPLLQGSVGKFWKELFQVADAVREMHVLEVPSDAGAPGQEWHGWHADIKPDNILRVQGRFKLADPGFATFKRKAPKEETPKEFILGGTESYGAPEHHRSQLARKGTATAVTQAIDIWSLGCVFSMAATWMVMGYSGVIQFCKLVRNASQQPTGDAKSLQEQRDSAGYGGSDSFHDGRRVLKEVLMWHKMLRSALRKTDLITCPVLDIVDEKMLLEHPGHRITAKKLRVELENILTRAEKSGRPPEPAESILRVLSEDGKDRARKVVRSQQYVRNTNQSLDIAGARKMRKSIRFRIPDTKTTQNSEDMVSALKVPEVEIGSPPGIPQVAPPQTQRLSDSSTSNIVSPITPTSNQHVSYKDWKYAPSHPSTRKNGQAHDSKLGSSRPNGYQNVFQAREEVDAREKNNILGRIRKDSLLTRYFGADKRDVVFLVDNAESMSPHWYQARFLLATLVMKLAGQDKDGMDLHFTSGPISAKRRKKRDAFEKAMEHSDAKPRPNIRTDMRQKLGEIFEDYMRKLRENPKSKYLTLIILTDGIWAGMAHQDANDELNAKIVEFVRQVTAKNLENRPVSIEFIQIGDDEDATNRLRHLDDGLKEKGIPDIIDTEPADGNVNKMLLGSFVAEYDEEDQPINSSRPHTRDSEWHPRSQIGDSTKNGAIDPSPSDVPFLGGDILASPATASESRLPPFSVHRA